MHKKLSKQGDRLALVFDRSILESLAIDESTPLEISTDGSTLTVAPVRIDKALNKPEPKISFVNERFPKTFRRLA